MVFSPSTLAHGSGETRRQMPFKSKTNREMIDWTISKFNPIGRSLGPFHGWLCKIAVSKELNDVTTPGLGI
jgi:hypothetical protein